MIWRVLFAQSTIPPTRKKGTQPNGSVPFLLGVQAYITAKRRDRPGSHSRALRRQATAFRHLCGQRIKGVRASRLCSQYFFTQYICKRSDTVRARILHINASILCTFRLAIGTHAKPKPSHAASHVGQYLPRHYCSELRKIKGSVARSSRAGSQPPWRCPPRGSHRPHARWSGSRQSRLP